MHLWDGSHVVEIAAFGSSITGQLESIRSGDEIKLMAAELGWRAGYHNFAWTLAKLV